MIIKRSSWHYKLSSELYTTFHTDAFPEYKSICPYFWSLVGNLFLATVFTTLLLWAALALPITGYSWLHNGSLKAKEVFIGIAVTYAVIAIIGCLLVGFARVELFFEKNPESKAKKVKDKICPLVTYQ